MRARLLLLNRHVLVPQLIQEVALEQYEAAPLGDAELFYATWPVGHDVAAGDSRVPAGLRRPLLVPGLTGTLATLESKERTLVNFPDGSVGLGFRFHAGSRARLLTSNLRWLGLEVSVTEVDVEPTIEVDEASDAIRDRMRQARDAFARWVSRYRGNDAAAAQRVEQFRGEPSAWMLAWNLLAHAPLPLLERRRLLPERDVGVLLEEICVLLRAGIEDTPPRG